MKKIFESTGQKVRLLFLINILIASSYLFINGATVKNVAISMLIYFLFTSIGMVCTFHRFYSHKSFEFRNNVLKYFCTMLGLLSGSGSVIGWCGIHNKHHDKHDTPDDPHDSKRGFFNLITLNYNYDIELKYVKYLLKNKFLIMTHQYYFLLILMYAMLLTLSLGFEGLVFGFCLPSMIVLFVSGLTTYFLHEGGSPQTVRWMNMLVFGDGNHFEHHKNSKRYRHEHDDVSGWIIHNVLRRA